MPRPAAQLAPKSTTSHAAAAASHGRAEPSLRLHRLEAAEADGEVASAHRAREHLCAGESGLLADPASLHELGLRDEGDAEDEPAE